MEISKRRRKEKGEKKEIITTGKIRELRKKKKEVKTKKCEYRLITRGVSNKV